MSKESTPNPITGDLLSDESGSETDSAQESDAKTINVRVKLPKSDLESLAQEAMLAEVPVEQLIHQRYVAPLGIEDGEPKEKWDVLFEFRCGVDVTPAARQIAHTTPRSCLFCGRTKPVATFKKIAHIVPAAFGNRSLFSLDECDGCNARAGKLFENDLVNSLTPERALWGLRSRRGRVKHSISGLSSVSSSGLSSNIYVDSDDPSVTVSEVIDGGFEVYISGRKYRPMAVAKALARMALFVLAPNDCQSVDWMFAWLRGEVEWLPTYADMFVSGPHHPDYMLKIYRTHTADRPFCVEFGTGNFKLGMSLPTLESVEESKSEAVRPQVSMTRGNESFGLIRVLSETWELDSSKTFHLSVDSVVHDDGT
jgi:hypothetical protein